MSDFANIQNSVTKQWTILAPRRAKRPQEGQTKPTPCPFCPGREGEEVLYEVPNETKEATSPWLIRVLPNKFPFTPHHEVIIHSPDHHKNVDELPLSQVILLLQTYKQRFLFHKEDGFVYIFHNRGVKAGESLPHPHSQLTIIPKEMMEEIPTLASGKAFLQTLARSEQEAYLHETAQFRLFSPLTAQWPDELWVASKRLGTTFGAISDMEIEDLALTLQTLVRIYTVRHGQEFPFNLYIYPGVEWYLRLIPREKTLGGFELGTGISVNTQDPKETMSFIKMHLPKPDLEKIKNEHKALYHRAV